MFATEFGFVHHRPRRSADSQSFCRESRTIHRRAIEWREKGVVLTWGFAPDDEPSVSLVQQLRSAGFEVDLVRRQPPRCPEGVPETRHSSGDRSLRANVIRIENCRDRRATEADSR